jgi:glycosyltransferase involved in cell wall biosynthesis
LEGRLVLGFVGWFRKWHGLETLLEIFHEAKLKEAGVRLMLIGDGPAAPNLRRFVQEQELTEAVVFTGPVDRKEMPAHVAALDIALQPSVTEYASPMKIFEYMGMGKCIVAPDQPNIREILKDRETAFLFKPGDRETFKAALIESIESPQLRETLGRQAAQAIFDRGFLWRSNAERTLDLIFTDHKVEKKKGELPRRALEGGAK